MHSQCQLARRGCSNCMGTPRLASLRSTVRQHAVSADQSNPIMRGSAVSSKCIGTKRLVSLLSHLIQDKFVFLSAVLISRRRLSLLQA